ncbi:hypothetical protein JYU17_00575, partial [Flavobacteriaceae bacterium AH-315-O20]|nr:hypothetical protein [Flavobacteriaceae bacterium AH-315-O20]
FFADTPQGTFYNLIVGKTPTGEAQEPYVLKYTCNQDQLETYLNNNKNFAYFIGTIALHKYTDYFKSGYFNKGNVNCPPTFDEVGDPIPCDDITVNGGNSTVGGGNTENGNYGSPGDYGGSDDSSGGDPNGGDSDGGDSDGGDSDGGDSGEGGNGTGSSSPCLRWLSATEFVIWGDCLKYFDPEKLNKGNVCPECPNPDGGIGVNTTSTANSINSILGGTLNSAQLSWLSDLSNFEKVAAIKAFLKQNTNKEAKDFVRASIETMMDGGEADFNNEILKDKSFIGTKADCVLNALISKGNNIFKKTSQAFTGGRSKFKLKFTTYNDPADQADARTGIPESGSTIITVKFNLFVMQSNYSIDLAGTILHETIHAELHRIKLSNNAEPNSLPADQYNWYLDLWTFHEGSYEDENGIATEAEHDFMSNYFINPIASGLREFDDNTHPLENYKFYAWEGLQDYGKRNGFITQTELSNLAQLSKTVRDDIHTNPCD